MALKGQEYKQGLVIQRSDKGSAFQEVVDATIGDEGILEATLPGGIKKATVTTSESTGSPMEFDELPEAAEEYVGKFAVCESKFYHCEETEGDEPTYAWVEYVAAE